MWWVSSATGLPFQYNVSNQLLDCFTKIQSPPNIVSLSYLKRSYQLFCYVYKTVPVAGLTVRWIRNALSYSRQFSSWHYFGHETITHRSIYIRYVPLSHESIMYWQGHQISEDTKYIDFQKIVFFVSACQDQVVRESWALTSPSSCFHGSEAGAGAWLSGPPMFQCNTNALYCATKLPSKFPPCCYLAAKNLPQNFRKAATKLPQCRHNVAT